MVTPNIVRANGEEVVWKYTVTNNSAVIDRNVAALITIPDGITYVSYSATKGSFLRSNRRWMIGTLLPGQAVTIEIKTIVQDIHKGPFQDLICVGGDNVDLDPSNNKFVHTVNVEIPAPVAIAEDDINGCLCGSVAENDTACDRGTSIWVLVENSLQNLILNEFIPETGWHSFTLIDGSLPGSFSYKIVCLDDDGSFLSESSPAIARIAPVAQSMPGGGSGGPVTCADVNGCLRTGFSTPGDPGYVWKVDENGVPMWMPDSNSWSQTEW